ncbi:hypothetical protein ACR77Z_05695 [Bacteroides fragilis]|nr:hypothetical protein [Bacteroides fragilis]MCS2417088.1 hypothetical protein [Bacteroides fragilis]MCZ2599315.1 hypothetical protein [Bacteroides fragilis]
MTDYVFLCGRRNDSRQRKDGIPDRGYLLAQHAATSEKSIAG